MKHQQLLKKLAAELVSRGPLSLARLADLAEVSQADARTVLLGMRDASLVKLKAGGTTVLYEATADLRQRVLAQIREELGGLGITKGGAS